MPRAHRLATVVWSVVAAGATCGFIARDLLGLPRTAVALAWIAGALAGGVAARGACRRLRFSVDRADRSEKGPRVRRTSV
jgi:hypothetical protein